MSEDVIPEYLWHYTTPKGLLGIASSKLLWATNIRYLNDASEYLHSVRAAEVLIAESGPINKTEFDYLGYLLGTSPLGAWMRARNRGSQYFVVSMTAAPDLLSQWRTYAPKSGYCVGWGRRAVAAFAKKNEFELRRCIYDPLEQRKLLTPVVVDALNQWRENPCELSFESMFWAPKDDQQRQAYTRLGEYAKQFDSEFGRVATTCKNPAFTEEAEWRLISVEYPKSRNILHTKFREGKSVLIPYVEFFLDIEPAELADADAQTRIICGPSPEIDLAQDAALRLFAVNNWRGGVGTQQSQTPYRDW
jgi:hypothetical protein